MLVISRKRPQQQDAGHLPVAQRLATKFNVKVLTTPLLYDLPAESPVLERLRNMSEPASFLIPLSYRASKNLLIYLKIPFAEIFETEDEVQIPKGSFPDGTATDGQVECIEDLAETATRWYPIIDMEKCRSCLECVNYCLFGVYSVGKAPNPVVDQPDSCRDGCPACARVCPSGAIMFPLYEDRLIAGYGEMPTDELDDLVNLVDNI